MTNETASILCALLRRFDPRANLVIDEAALGFGGRADLIVVSKSGYVTEIEIKVSLADWNRETKKRKTPRASRLYFAIPKRLLTKVPEWVPEHAGILTLAAGCKDLDEYRPARRLSRPPLPAIEITHLRCSLYFRYWDMRRRALARAQAQTLKAAS